MKHSQAVNPEPQELQPDSVLNVHPSRFESGTAEEVWKAAMITKGDSASSPLDDHCLQKILSSTRHGKVLQMFVQR